MQIADLVTDWGGFEKLVAKLHETGEVAVEHNVTLPGRSGAARQIDVLIRHKQGLYDHLVVAECKFWNSQVERLHVDALATTVREVGASRGVIFSTKGFQSGAITQAEHDSIDLFVVRDLRTEEWGQPGRVIELFLHIIQTSIGNLLIKEAAKIGQAVDYTPICLNIAFGPEGPLSSTPTLKDDGTPGGESLEQRICDVSQRALEQAIGEGFTLNGGAEGISYMMAPVNFEPQSPLLIPLNSEIVLIRKMSFDLGIKIDQSRLTFDRAKHYLFALAVENCVNGSVSTASRTRDAKHTVLAEVVKPKPRASGEASFVNGSVLRVFMKGFFPFAEMSGLQPVPDPRVKPSA